MSVKRIALLAALALLTLPALAGAASPLTAASLRFSNHRGFVRVVINFNGTISAREVVAGAVRKTTAAVRLNHPGVTTDASSGTGFGLTAALQPATQGLNIGLSFSPHRFKYIYYAAEAENVLAIDLWKSAPPAGAIRTCAGLTLTHVNPATPGLMIAGGAEHGLFENQFQVVVRGANGLVLGRQTGVHGPGNWTAHVHYTAGRRQTGTLEAVAFSPKDAAIDCLAEAPVTLPAG
ncbi:MAG: hypothetical protein QOG85_1156 [Gaiellaceae bacterium]|jgi:hypothetical protein|nr:hypothetical protein [Gaiellaceae bacterium]